MSRDRGDVGFGVDAWVGVGGGEARSEQYSGTKALMLAVMEDAIRAFLSNERRAREEAESWIFGPHPRSVFSFTVVCETLGLEPKAVRVAMRRLSDRAVSATTLPRSRPNARGSGTAGNSAEAAEE